MSHVGNVYHWLISKKIPVVLILITALAAGLRFYRLGGPSLWLDEAISVHFSSQNLSTIIAQSWYDRTNPPLYWLILHFWINWFGTGEAAVRSLSAIFGILAIPVAYLIGKSLFNNRAGLLAALISAVSYFHIYYSQETRNYSLLLLFALLSYLFFIKSLQNARRWYFLGYFLTNLFLVYTHLFGVFFIISQLLYFCIFRKSLAQIQTRMILVWIANLLCFFPLIFLLFPKAKHMIDYGFWIPQPNLSDLASTFSQYSGYGPMRRVLLIIFFLLASWGILFVPSTKIPPNRRSRIVDLIKGIVRPESLLLLLWLWVAIMVPFIVSFITTPVYLAKYTIGASPALYLIVARGIDIIQKKWLMYFFVLSIVVLSVTGIYSYYAQGTREQWRDAAAYVENRSENGDIIIITADYCRLPFDYYYRRNLAEYATGEELKEAEKVEFLQKTIPGAGRVFLIISHVDTTVWIQEYLVGLYPVVEKQQFIGINVILFDLQSAGR